MADKQQSKLAVLTTPREQVEATANRYQMMNRLGQLRVLQSEMEEMAEYLTERVKLMDEALDSLEAALGIVRDEGIQLPTGEIIFKNQSFRHKLYEKARQDPIVAAYETRTGMWVCLACAREWDTISPHGGQLRPVPLSQSYEAVHNSSGETCSVCKADILAEWRAPWSADQRPED
jgi:hypothetical protein